MAKYIPLASEINLREYGFIFDVGSLFELFASLHDGRDPRGIRYALTTILVWVVLAKLAGMDSLRATPSGLKHTAQNWRCGSAWRRSAFRMPRP